MRSPHTCIFAALIVILWCGPVRAQDWPDIFEPLELLSLHLEMDPADWYTVQHDESLSVAVPAMLWADGEEPMLISVRRKSGDPLTGAAEFVKVSLKLDINEYVMGQDWHNLKSLSLENGDDRDVVREGMAWYLHRLASGTQGYDYSAGLACWVRLYINGVYTGVYVSAEQRDQRFLENRDWFTEGETWLYKVSDVGEHELKVGGPEDSPTVLDLCYLPFAETPTCPTPDSATLAVELPNYVDMDGLLTLAAVGVFTCNDDAIFSHGKNFYFADFLAGQSRLYFPWDQDAVLTTVGGGTCDLYATDSSYAEILLNVPEFRARYSEILNDLVCGPWSLSGLGTFLDELEPVLSTALALDPNNQIDGTVAEHFDGIRDWLSQRIVGVSAGIEGFQACPTVNVVLNEFMASNFGTIEDPDEPGEYPDWIEVYNPNASAVDLGGVYLTDDLTDPMKYQVPAGVSIPAGGYLVFWADDDGTQGPLHTNFKLSAGGEAVAIFDTDGVTQLDAVVFGPQMTDVSFGRYPNASGAWDFMPDATPGAPNGPHNAPPTISGTTRDPDLPQATDPVWVTANVIDLDGTVVGVTLTYDTGSEAVDLQMHDDGNHADGVAGDNVYGGQIPAAPQDTVVSYYVAATDDVGDQSTDPPGAPVATYAYFVGYEPPPLSINEFMAANVASYEDPQYPGNFDDWIEIYNAGDQPVDLGGMHLTDNLDNPTKWQVPAGISIPAKGYLVFWADEEPLQGDTHAGFKLSANGEHIGLFDSDAAANMAIDTITFGLQTADVSYGRCPNGIDDWQYFTAATPGSTNSAAADINGDGFVNASDLALLLGAWGPNPGHPADLTQDDMVNASDLAQLLGSWGPSC